MNKNAQNNNVIWGTWHDLTANEWLSRRKTVRLIQISNIFSLTLYNRIFRRLTGLCWCLAHSAFSAPWCSLIIYIGRSSRIEALEGVWLKENGWHGKTWSKIHQISQPFAMLFFVNYSVYVYTSLYHCWIVNMACLRLLNSGVLASTQHHNPQKSRLHQKLVVYNNALAYDLNPPWLRHTAPETDTHDIRGADGRP